ncbi:thermonuclease family protein [Desulfomicrobium escambiense]|uniref:thermonuclease family protein n=1 Tax=Desulfomicrobium escambiense TaxID=29503 RepID=UPI00048D27CA|nr:thermonuclease family protein [Desulfomicrobium escambiense]
MIVILSQAFPLDHWVVLRAVVHTGFLLAMLVLMPGRVDAWQGRVVNVLDGDTVEVMNCNGKIVRIHLYGVEAPRKTQYFGDECTQYFARLVESKSIHVINVGRDLLGRMRSLVWIEGMSVNEEMVRAGYAWVSNPVGLSPSCEKWMGVQVVARENRAGLWQELQQCLARGRVPDLPPSCPIY